MTVQRQAALSTTKDAQLHGAEAAAQNVGDLGVPKAVGVQQQARPLVHR